MLRTLNYTGRRRIAGRRIQVSIARVNDKIRSFEFDIDLEGLELPASAPVTVEAYSGPDILRFAWGTVADLRPPADRSLQDLAGDHVYFRVKVVEPGDGTGRLLAFGDGFRPDNEEDHPEVLLPVEVREDLTDIPWELQFYPRALLVLSQQVDGLKETVRFNPGFRAWVYPSIFREVLNRVLVVEGWKEMDDEEHWSTGWIRLAESLQGEVVPSANAQELTEWISEASRRFSQRHLLMRAAVNAQEEI